MSAGQTIDVISVANAPAVSGGGTGCSRGRSEHGRRTNVPQSVRSFGITTGTSPSIDGVRASVSPSSSDRSAGVVHADVDRCPTRDRADLASSATVAGRSPVFSTSKLQVIVSPADCRRARTVLVRLSRRSLCHLGLRGTRYDKRADRGNKHNRASHGPYCGSHLCPPLPVFRRPTGGALVSIVSTVDRRRCQESRQESLGQVDEAWRGRVVEVQPRESGTTCKAAGTERAPRVRRPFRLPRNDSAASTGKRRACRRGLGARAPPKQRPRSSPFRRIAQRRGKS